MLDDPHEIADAHKQLSTICSAFCTAIKDSRIQWLRLFLASCFSIRVWRCFEGLLILVITLSFGVGLPVTVAACAVFGWLSGSDLRLCILVIHEGSKQNKILVSFMFFHFFMLEVVNNMLLIRLLIHYRDLIRAIHACKTAAEEHVVVCVVDYCLFATKFRPLILGFLCCVVAVAVSFFLLPYVVAVRAVVLLDLAVVECIWLFFDTCIPWLTPFVEARGCC
ncbi:hypothetical protein QVD17_37660 [Tagetes erecta]|uniref:Uncharacterized protein n=1 Tax=Tagetes erecta TaxID=13708 RepID=A0AAD8JYP6_TARER|nr:hypothetical protein QVD17_37660 [Tagetes erecta]